MGKFKNFMSKNRANEIVHTTAKLYKLSLNTNNVLNELYLVILRIDYGQFGQKLNYGYFKWTESLKIALWAKVPTSILVNKSFFFIVFSIFSYNCQNQTQYINDINDGCDKNITHDFKHFCTVSFIDN